MNDVMLWRRRRTARWQALSLSARGAVEGIVAASDERGELQLPPDGLQALASVLGRPWEEVEPAIAEVLRVGKLVFDRERMVIVDPSRAKATAADVGEIASLRAELDRLRSELAATARPRPAMAAAIAASAADRPLSMTPNAIRKRAAYARKRAEGQEPVADPRQLALPGADAANGAAMAARPLSDRSSSSKRSQRGVIPLDGRELPGGWLTAARERRPDVAPERIAKLWSKFAAEKSRSFRSWPVVQSRWEDWLDRERVAAPAPSPKPSTTGVAPPRPEPAAAPYYAPAKLAVPDVEPPAPPSKPPIVKRLPPDPATVAAASRFASLFNLPPPRGPEPRSLSA